MIKIGSPKQKQMEMFYLILNTIYKDNKHYNLKSSDIKLIDFQNMAFRLNGQESEVFEYALEKLRELGLIQYKEISKFNFYFKEGVKPIPYQDAIGDNFGYTLGYLSSVKNLVLTGKGLIIMDALTVPVNLQKTPPTPYAELSKDDKMVALIDWYKNFLGIVLNRIQL